MQQAAYLALMFMLAGQAVAQNALSSQERELLEVSGTYESLADLDAQFNAGLQQSASQGTISEELLNSLLSLSSKHLNKQTMIATLEADFVGQLSAQVLEDSLNWYKSSLGAQINRAEIDSGTPEEQKKMLENAAQLMSDSQRVELEKRILSTLDWTDTYVDMQQKITFGLVDALAFANSNGEPVNIEPIKKQIIASTPAMKSQFDQLLLLTLLNAHKSFTIEELIEYEKFVNSKSAQSFHNHTARVLINAIESAMLRIASDIKAL